MPNINAAEKILQSVNQSICVCDDDGDDGGGDMII